MMKKEAEIKAKLGEMVKKLSEVEASSESLEFKKLARTEILGFMDALSWVLGSETTIADVLSSQTKSR